MASKRDATAAKIAAKMAKLKGVEDGDQPTNQAGEADVRDGQNSPSSAQLEGAEGTSERAQTPSLESGGDSPEASDQPSGDAAVVADSPADSTTPDPEDDPEIARLEAQGINALVEVDSLPEPEFPAPLPESQQGELITIHFLEDGMSFDGRVWYRGEEISCRRGDETFQKTVDRNGKSWLDMTENDQAYMYERIMFRPGPWPYQSMEERLAELGLGGATNDRDRKRQQREAKPPLPMSR